MMDRIYDRNDPIGIRLVLSKVVACRASPSLDHDLQNRKRQAAIKICQTQIMVTNNLRLGFWHS